MVLGRGRSVSPCRGGTISRKGVAVACRMTGRPGFQRAMALKCEPRTLAWLVWHPQEVDVVVDLLTRVAGSPKRAGFGALRERIKDLRP